MSDTEKIFGLTNDFLFKAVFGQESNNIGYDWCGCLEPRALGVIVLFIVSDSIIASNMPYLFGKWERGRKIWVKLEVIENLKYGKFLKI